MSMRFKRMLRPACGHIARARLAVPLVAAFAAAPGAGSADETGAGRGTGKLQFSATAYVWAAGLQGEQALFGLPPVSVDLDFGDILDDVDVAVAGIVEARGDRFGFLGELNYVKLGAAAAGPGGVLTGGFDTKAFFALAAGTWRVKADETGNVDLIAGAKYFNFKNSVRLLPGPVAATDNASFADVTVGVKGSVRLAPRWRLLAWAMVGAGGSDLSWDALAAFDYQLNDRWSASFGYRAMGVDYSSGGFAYDMTQSGPVLGITARF